MNKAKENIGRTTTETVSPHGHLVNPVHIFPYFGN